MKGLEIQLSLNLRYREESFPLTVRHIDWVSLFYRSVVQGLLHMLTAESLLAFLFSPENHFTSNDHYSAYGC